MRNQIHKEVLEIVERISKCLGNTLEPSTTLSITRPEGKGRVKDATLAFYVDGKKSENDVVVLISNTLYPEAVHFNVSQAHEIARRVSPQVSLHIQKPIAKGKIGERTYAAFSRLSPISEYRIVRATQKYRAASRTLPWIVGLAKETMLYRDTPKEFERYFLEPLVSLRDSENVSDKVRIRAAEYLEIVRKKEMRWFTAVQHGDFWIGNVMFERRAFTNINPALGDFSVIDWGGARLDGYPCFDWMRLCRSLFGYGASKNKKFVASYTDSLGISALEFEIYCFLALGKLGAELDQFPMERYIGACDRTLAYIDALSR